LLHSHQPVGNFDHVIEETYQRAYQPFIDLLQEHPKIRVSLHYTGYLLEWIERHHPEFLAELHPLIDRGQLELFGGGFYEPILPVISDRDKRAQIQRLKEFIQSRFGVTPRGAWLAERVWEPSLAKPLAESGVQYIVLDDTHFTLAGLEAKSLNGYYYTEDAGLPLRLVPSIKSLRYTIPFREPAETIETLRRGLDSDATASPLFAMGDDLEKFGGWPHTFEHCYTNRWLERFYGEIESAGDWLETTTLGDYLDSNAPLGRIYLPTASYEEMMTWALPLEAARELRACLAESDGLPGAERFHRFLRGGLWRNFLAKYPESNQVHKLMLEVGRRWEAAALSGPSSPERAALLSEAENHLLASQCNDAYWHGVFGGLYTPHLRAGILQHLIKAECALDRVEAATSASIVRSDFDCDGSEEIQLRHPLYGMVLRPADGGTVSSMRFKPADIELVNSLARRPEEYHDEVREKAKGHATRGAVPESIQTEVPRAAEENLADFLRYDRYLRHVFRSYVFPADKDWQDFDQLRLEEAPQLAAGAWSVDAAELDASGTARFALSITAKMDLCGSSRDLSATKWIGTRAQDSTWRIECRSQVAVAPALLPVQNGVAPARVAPALLPVQENLPLAFGLELVFNLLAPDAPGRYFLGSAKSSRYEPLKFRGELAGGTLLIVDEWQGVKITVTADPEPRWWIVPIDTVSQAVEGFERVYQGSAILAVWNAGSAGISARFPLSSHTIPERAAGKDARAPGTPIDSKSPTTHESRLTIDVEPWRP